MLTRVVRSWIRIDQYLAELKSVQSETIREQLGFTPFACENIGLLTDTSSGDSFLFSSDYLDVVAGADPIGRFEKSLNDRSEQVRANFYAENFFKLFPAARVHRVCWPTGHSPLTWIRLVGVRSN
jgi:hypothetical protein